jgi:hypothetical protein
MLRVDQKREGAAPADLVAVANAEHALRIGRPVDPVVGEVPAIGGLADRRQDVFELDASLGVIAEARDAVAALRTRRRLGIRLGKLLRGCTQLTAPSSHDSYMKRLLAPRLLADTLRNKT